ncbi:MAG: biopolymer transporter ExbD [Phycisphaeraceae bacterium]|nr:MAG: biopolymer transporter ExbD [Phycisphaeraceae bacterium]
MTLPHHGWRRRDASAIYQQHVGPNMTPMVDVVMVILIFFMASTVIMGPELLLRAGLDAKKGPKGDQRFAIAAPVFTLRLHVESNRVVATGLGLDAAPLDWLAGAAKSLADEIDPDSASVSIAPEDQVPYEAVIAAQDTLTAAGFRKVKLK